MCVNTWANAGVEDNSVCANVCVFQTVNAPQKNKMSFHQAPFTQLHLSSYIHVFFFFSSPKSMGIMANVLQLMSDISHGENWVERVLGLSLQWACLRIKGGGGGQG